jgi:hypothetical protein
MQPQKYKGLGLQMVNHMDFGLLEFSNNPPVDVLVFTNYSQETNSN